MGVSAAPVAVEVGGGHCLVWFWLLSVSSLLSAVAFVLSGDIVCFVLLCAVVCNVWSVCWPLLQPAVTCCW